MAKYAMRGSQRPDPASLVPPSTKRSYAVKADVSTARISEALAVNIAYSRNPFCECAMLGSPRVHLALLVSSHTNPLAASDATSDCVALRIRKMRRRIGDFRDSPRNISYIDTPTIICGSSMVRGGLSRARCGGVRTRIAHSRKCAHVVES